MGVLAEYLQAEVTHIRAELGRRRELLDEWLTSLSKLYDLLEEWVREADGGLGLLGINRHTTTELISEPRLGNYNVNLMWIVLGASLGAARKVIVVPHARHVIATIKPPGREPRRADGMVEIKGGVSPDYYLFRLKGDNGDAWYIQNVARWNADPEYGTVEELNRDRFEAAILTILK